MGLRDRLKSLRDRLRKKEETVVVSTSSPPKTLSVRSIDYGTKSTTRTGGVTVTTSRSSGGGSRTTVSSVGRTPSTSSPSVQRAIQTTNQQATKTQSDIQAKARATALVSNVQQRQTVKPSFNERAIKTATKIARFPEEKVIEPALQKVRETKGTQVVYVKKSLGRGGFSTEAEARLKGNNYIRTPLNLAGVIDVGSFFIPVVSGVRSVTYVGKVGGNIIDNPNYIIEKPLEVIGGVVIGVEGVLSSAGKVSSKIASRDITKLSTKELQFVQVVNKEKGTLGFYGSRNYKDLVQQIGSAGRLLKTESGRIQFIGEGASVTSGKISKILGINQRGFIATEGFQVGSKGFSKKIGDIGKIQISKAIGSTGIQTSTGRIKDISSSTLLKFNDKLSLSKSKGATGIVYNLGNKIVDANVGFRAGRTGIGTTQKINFDLVQSLKKINPIAPKTKNTLSAIPKIDFSKASSTETNIIPSTSLFQIRVSDPIQTQGLSAGTLGRTSGRTSSSSRSSSRTKQDIVSIPKITPRYRIDQRTKQKNIPKLNSILTSINTPKNTNFPRININTDFSNKTPRFKLPNFKVKQSVRTPKGFGFTTEVRRYGKFKPVASFSAGKSIVTGTLGATIRVSGKGSKKLKTPTGFKKKKDKKGILFIEQPKYRLSKKGEKVEIQQAKRRKKK